MPLYVMAPEPTNCGVYVNTNVNGDARTIPGRVQQRAQYNQVEINDVNADGVNNRALFESLTGSALVMTFTKESDGSGHSVDLNKIPTLGTTGWIYMSYTDPENQPPPLEQDVRYAVSLVWR